MNQAPEEFEALRKLLKLKRYEQPPPGYFNSFSSQVMARLEVEKHSRAVDLLSAEAPWARRLVRMLETNPFFAGAFGVAVCSLLIFGITSFQNVDRTSPVAIVSDDGTASAPVVLTKSMTESFSSINPRFNTNISSGSPFGSLSVSAEPVLFSPDH